MRKHALISATALGVAVVLATGGCSVSAKDSDDGATSAPTSHGGATSGGSTKDVVLVTHDSWNMPKNLVAQFEQQTGYHLVVRASGDAGKLTNKLVLTQGNPDGDVSFGVDNTFATRALKADVFAGYKPGDVPEGASTYDLPGDGGQHLTPVDHADVCVNVDTTWFAAHHLAPPKDLADLIKPAYKNLFVTPGATTSSPGMAFLLATIAKYADGWQDYWKKLVGNGLKIEKDWSNAYEVDFSAGGGNGDRPIVVSYSSSPPFTVPKGASKPTTSALLGTCFRQVEFAGVLKGAKNPEGMQKFIDFMSAKAFQAALPENMYVYPVDTSVALPPDWKRFAPIAPKPYAVTPDDITAHRDAWLTTWSEITHT